MFDRPRALRHPLPRAGPTRRPRAALSATPPGLLLGAVVAGSALLPSSRASAQWIEPPGAGWSSLAVYHQNTRESYDGEGERGDFPGNGHTVATQSFLTVARVLTDGVDGWAQLSYQRLVFEDLTGRATSVGFGDMRFYGRVSPFLLLGRVIPVAIRAGVKVPVGDFDVGSNMIPLGDGQRDWEVMVEVGRSFYPAPIYAQGWVGHRWRESRDGGRTDFGDERFFYAAVGGTAAAVDFKASLEGWTGSTPVFNGVPAVGAQREMLRAALSVLVAAGPGQLEVGGRAPLGGKNLPAGADLVLGYFVRLGTPGG